MVCRLLRRFTPRNDSTPTSSLRELLATRGNLVMGHSDNQTKLVIARVHRTRGNLVIFVSSLQRPKICGNDNIKNKNHQIIWWDIFNLFFIYSHNNIDILLKKLFY